MKKVLIITIILLVIIFVLWKKDYLKEKFYSITKKDYSECQSSDGKKGMWQNGMCVSTRTI